MASGMFINRVLATPAERGVAVIDPKNLTPKQMGDLDFKIRESNKRYFERIDKQCRPKWAAMEKQEQDALARSVLPPFVLKLFLDHRDSWLALEPIFDAMLSAEFGER